MTREEFKKKWENYWFYYRIHTIVAILAILVVGALVKQCMDRVEPDMTVVMVSKNIDLTSTQLTSLEKHLEKYTKDVNGDGRKVVFCDYYYMNEKANQQMVYTLSQKLMAIMAGTDSALYVTDDSYYKQLSGKHHLFFKLGNVGAKAQDSYRVKLSSLPDFKLSDAPPGYGDLTLSIRTFGDPFAKSYQGSSFKNSADILKRLLKNGGLLKQESNQ